MHQRQKLMKQTPELPKSKQDEQLVNRGLNLPDFSRELPDLDVVTVDEAPCLLQGFFIVHSIEAMGAENVSVLIEEVRAVILHVGARSPGDSSHSLMCEPVSAWRARRMASSRNLPSGRLSASSRRRLAS